MLQPDKPPTSIKSVQFEQAGQTAEIKMLQGRWHWFIFRKNMYNHHKVIEFNIIKFDTIVKINIIFATFIKQKFIT